MKRILCIALALALALMSACSQQPAPAKEVDLNAVMTALSSAFGLEDGMMSLTQDDLLEMYGIESADVKQFSARIPLESLLADEIVLIEAADAQAASRVKEKLEARYQAKLNENKDYLPEEYAKVQKCKVAVTGNFVSMIIFANADEVVAEYEKALK